MAAPLNRIERGKHRLKVFKHHYAQIVGTPIGGKLLDFGAGAGEFLLAAVNDGIDAYGVDTEDARINQFRRLAAAFDAVEARHQRYSGRFLPFDDEHFDTVYSWYVFEHVADPWQAVKEIARVTKSDGIVAIHAQDARCAYEGHAGVPWPPFLPREFIAAYLDELGLEEHIDFVTEQVFYVTAPQLASAFQSFGFEVMFQNDDPPDYYPEAMSINSDATARQAARDLKQLKEEGRWNSPTQDLQLYLKKRSNPV